MNCRNCGANLDLNTSNKYITCNYCSTANSNYSPFEDVDSLIVVSKNKDLDILKNVVLSFKLKEYEEVIDLADNILRENPSSWVAMTYKALSLFWLGSDNFSHLNDVSTLLEKAKILSDNNEFVIDAVQAIANDAVVLACKNELYGDDLINSLDAFSFCKGLISLKVDSIEKMNDYCNRSFEKIKSSLEQFMK